jgi:primosomal protein N'
MKSRNKISMVREGRLEVILNTEQHEYCKKASRELKYLTTSEFIRSLITRAMKDEIQSKSDQTLDELRTKVDRLLQKNVSFEEAFKLIATGTSMARGHLQATLDLLPGESKTKFHSIAQRAILDQRKEILAIFPEHVEGEKP